jgi:hypothetical protein
MIGTHVANSRGAGKGEKAQLVVANAAGSMFNRCGRLF